MGRRRLTSFKDLNEHTKVGVQVGSMAAMVLSQRHVATSTFGFEEDSLEAVANHEIDAADALQANRAPVAIIAAEHDQIVPTDRTDALRKRAPHVVFDRTIKNAGHNDIYARSDFQEAMREALATIRR